MNRMCPTCGEAILVSTGARGRPPVRHPACATAFRLRREAERMRRNRSEMDTRQSRLDVWHQIRLFLYQEAPSPLELLMISEEA